VVKSPRTVQGEVIGLLYERLLRCPPRIAIYRELAKIREPRITDWLLKHLSIEQDSSVAAVIRKALGVRSRIHPGFTRRDAGPGLDDRAVFFSIEVDVASLPNLTAGSVQLPGEMRDPGNFQALPIDQWYQFDFSEGERAISAWFRLEDEDVIHLVLQERTV